MANLNGRGGGGGKRLWNSKGMGEKTYFGNSEGKGKLKYRSHLWYGMDLFWKCQILESDFAISSPDFSIEDSVNT